jgi:hypothetical protein
MSEEDIILTICAVSFVLISIFIGLCTETKVKDKYYDIIYQGDDPFRHPNFTPGTAG